MPHAGLMNEREMTMEAGSLLRARLHLRSGKRRLRQGKISAGLVTLYDAVSAAMDWYLAGPERVKLLNIAETDNLKDENNIYSVLVRSGVLDRTLDYDKLDKLVERALLGEMEVFDYAELLETLNSFMTHLGVMPFDEDALPSEDPSTY